MLEAADPMIMPGEIAWLNNAATGNARGKAVIGPRASMIAVEAGRGIGAERLPLI